VVAWGVFLPFYAFFSKNTVFLAKKERNLSNVV
jgi:hypothetical protein